MSPVGFTIACGNPFDGITLCGFYTTHIDAENAADKNRYGGDWWVVPINPE